MFDVNGIFNLQLGTSKRILSTDILKDREKAVFLTKPPFDYKKPLIDSFSASAFLSAFSDSEYHFSQTKNSEIRICGQKLKNFLIFLTIQLYFFEFDTDFQEI